MDAATDGHALGHPRERGLAAFAYVLTWATGLVVFLLVRRHERFARWHALQAVALGAVAMALMMVLNVLSTMLLVVAGRPTLFTHRFAWLSLGHLVWLPVLVLVVLCAARAYRGRQMRLPGLAGFADRMA